MDPVASGPAGTWTPGEPAGATAFSPGQVLSARVIQALAGDTYLVAVRGLQLVAQSSQSLALDSVVKLAVQGGGAGEPLRVQLVPGASAPSPGGPQPAAPAELARQLGLPPGPVTDLVITAFQEQGAALALPALRQAMRLVSQAQAQAPLTSLAPRVQAAATAELLATVQPAAGTPVAEEPVPVALHTATAQTAAPANLPANLPAVRSSPAAVPMPTAEPESLSAALVVSARVPAALPIRPSGSPAVLPGPRPGGAVVEVVSEPPPSGPSRPAPVAVVGRPPADSGPGEAPAATTLHRAGVDPVRAREEVIPPRAGVDPVRAREVGAPPTLPAPGRTVSPRSAPLPPGVPSVAAVIVTPVRSGEAARIYRQQPGSGDSLALRAAVQHAVPAAVATALARLAASPVPVTPLTVPLALAAGRPGLPTIAAQLPASTPVEDSLAAPEVSDSPDLVPRRAGQSQNRAERSAGSVERRQILGEDRAESAAPATRVARLPGTAAVLPVTTVALGGRQIGSPTETATLEMRPFAGKMAEPTAKQTAADPARRPSTAAPVPLPLPDRQLVDLARQPPRQAAEAALRLAGLVPQGGGQALTTDLGSLLRRLVVLATLPSAAAAGASSTSQPASSSTPAGAPESQALARVGLAALPAAEADPVTASTTGPSAPETAPTNPTPTTMLRDAVAQDLLPPKELADYDRVLALPLAVQGQPVPARLAVSTRRTADGGLACWMRVDCELSQLGPLSVRLGGADAGPVAITLVTTPAAGPTIAAAITALGDDLRAAGIDAALRVVVDDGSGT